MKRHIIFSFFCISSLGFVNAQHDHSTHTSDTANRSSHSDTTVSHSTLSHSFSLNLPMNIDGSGTGWLPANSPMYGYMIHSEEWNFMVHGNIFMRYNKQDIGDKGIRGNEIWDAPNWFMFMGNKKIGKHGLFHFNTMFSLDNLTVGGSGYPLLFQSGETYNNVPLVDRQHPHDLFSELSVAYSHALSIRSDLYLYIGFPGEPALGSVAFMHRPSAMFNPDAPLSHHWNDGTHITFGVATIGYRFNKLKLEVSSFTGREPDENRYDFDKPRFDSWSGRVSFAPSSSWSFQVSQGFLKSPEWLHPDEDARRSTVSGVFSRPLKNGGINLTGLWGLNNTDHKENAFLLEGAWNIKRWSLFGRYEGIEKSSEELNLSSGSFNDRLFFINALTIGFNFNLVKYLKTWLALGSHVSLFKPDNRLDTLYGNNPVAVEVYFRVFPDIMQMSNN